jgi:hypothetical protein
LVNVLLTLINRLLKPKCMLKRCFLVYEKHNMIFLALRHLAVCTKTFFFWNEAMWRKVWQGVVFMHNFWNFKAIPDTEIIFTSIQSKLVLKKFKWFQWRGFQKWWKFFILLLVKIWSDIWFVKKGLNFNLRVIENQIGSKHLFYLHE